MNLRRIFNSKTIEAVVLKEQAQKEGHLRSNRTPLIKLQLDLKDSLMDEEEASAYSRNAFSVPEVAWEHGYKTKMTGFRGRIKVEVKYTEDITGQTEPRSNWLVERLEFY